MKQLAFTTTLALAFVSGAHAQLREVRPPPRGFAAGWSDVTGSGVAIAFIQRLPLVPARIGAAAGPGGIGAHAQVHWRGLRPPPAWPGYENTAYVSVGVGRLFREGPGIARGEWNVVLGTQFWPDAKAGVFGDLGVGWFTAIGGSTPSLNVNGLTARVLIGWAF